jgi:hypothetical protein
MKTTKIDMSTVKGENVFEGAVWTKATPKEMAAAFNAIDKVNSSRKTA